MKLSEMTERERETLATLVRLMVGADGRLSGEESSDLQQVAQELGEDDFWALVRNTHGETYEREAVQADARQIERKDVQEQIYGVLFTLAAEGAIMGDEARLLDWVAETWKIDIQPIP